MSRFVILLSGDLEPTPRLAAQMKGARIIAADSGMRHAARLGLMPELWVGDFDSDPGPLPKAFDDIERQVHPADKDRTDGELAINEALARGATSLVIAGAFGGPRADQVFLHLAMAIRRAKEGIEIVITSGTTEGIPLLPGSQRFDLPRGTLFSILGFSHLSGVTVVGAKWPLDTVEVPFGSSLTTSNVVTGELRISIGVGRAVLLAYPADAPPVI